ncbi:ATP-binding protein [Nioella nitratireducens]|uniref:ATP-binding protein n=1 Tax=Nioella nitratireducens TaxID=1287720 RepID=UPI0008FD08B3|nr:ATP-binding protein [Nioella nitratireducens]
MKYSRYEISQIIEALNDLHVTTENDKEFEEHLSHLFKVGEDDELTHEPMRFTRGNEAHGIIYIDGSGGGKSTTIHRGLTRFKALAENPETTLPRWVPVIVKNPATLRSLGCDILNQLGVDKVSDRAKVYEIWDMVRHRLMVMGISLLWLDEAHDMFKKPTSTETENMLLMLKTLMQGDHAVVVVLSGTERLSAITGVESQVNRRFSKIRPKPLKFGADDDRVSGLINSYAERAGLKTDLRGDAIMRLMHGSRYRFGRCMETIIRAIRCALEDGADALKIEHFEIAWGQLEGCEVALNVFAMNDWPSLVLEDEEAQEAANSGYAPKKAAKSRKGRG